MIKKQIEFWLDLFIRHEISYQVLVKQFIRLSLLSVGAGVVVGVVLQLIKSYVFR